MELYIIRHGETVWNSKGLLQGRTDIELNEKGREIAGQRGIQLDDISFDTIYASPLIRAYETACLIRGHKNIPIIRDNRLKEICFGVYEGKNADTLFKDASDPFHHFFHQPKLYQAPDEGESFESVCIRTKEFMQEVIEPLEPTANRIMIVAHGALNKGIMCYIDHHGIKEYWKGGLQDNCGVIKVTLENSKYTVLDYGPRKR